MTEHEKSPTEVYVSFCETCRDFDLWIDGRKVKGDVAVEEVNKGGHKGVRATFYVKEPIRS